LQTKAVWLVPRVSNILCPVWFTYAKEEAVIYCSQSAHLLICLVLVDVYLKLAKTVFLARRSIKYSHIKCYSSPSFWQRDRKNAVVY